MVNVSNCDMLTFPSVGTAVGMGHDHSHHLPDLHAWNFKNVDIIMGKIIIKLYKDRLQPSINIK